MGIYTNGVLEKSLTTSLPPLTSVVSALSYIGRSLFSADAYLNATIDELRLYDGRLTPAEIAVNYRYGPDTLALPVSLVATDTPSNINLSWPSWAVGFSAESATNLASAVWSAVTPAPTLAAGNWSISVPKTNALKFFRLKR